MKTRYIVLMVVAAVLVFVLSLMAYTNNTAIGYEESINNAASGIQVQQQRQHDIILQLVQVVNKYSSFTAETQTQIAQFRAAAQKGNIAQAMTAIQAVAEAYPDLKADGVYQQLMTEMAISANLVAQYRDTYNSNVQSYHQFVRRWPYGMILHDLGYQVQDYPYLKFNDTQLPPNLFGG